MGIAVEVHVEERTCPLSSRSADPRIFFMYFLVCLSILIFSCSSQMVVTNTGPLAIFYQNNFNLDLSLSSPINDGYAPFVDIVLPSYFSVLSAKMKLTQCILFLYFHFFLISQASVAISRLSLNENESKLHPLTNKPVSSTFNGTLYSFKIPYTVLNNFQPTETLTIACTADFPNVIIFFPYVIFQRGGFLYGQSPTGTVPSYSVGGSGSVVDSWVQTETVTFVIFKVEVISPPRILTGPSYPYTVSLTGSGAKNLIIENITIKVEVPEEHSIISHTSASTDSNAHINNTIIPIKNSIAQNTTKNTWEFVVDKFEGSAGTDLTASYQFFGAKFNSTGGLVVTDTSLCTNSYKNITFTVTTSWFDNKTNITYNFTQTYSNPIRNCYLEYYHNANKQTGVVIGDSIEYYVRFSLSNYFSFGAPRTYIRLDIPDGINYDATINPFITGPGISGQKVIQASHLTVDTSAVGFDVDPITNGSTILLFQVGNETGFANFSGPSSYLLTFYGRVQEKFSDIFQNLTTNRDVISNLDYLTSSAQLYYNNILFTQPTTYSYTLRIADIINLIGALTYIFDIYGINGVVCYPLCSIGAYAANMNVTFIIRYDLVSQYARQAMVDLIVPIPILPAYLLTTNGPINDTTTTPDLWMYAVGPYNQRFTAVVPSASLTTQLFQLFYGKVVISTTLSTIDMLYSYNVADCPQFGEETFWTTTSVVTENNRPLIKTIGKGVSIPTLTIGTSFIASNNAAATYSNCTYCNTVPINSNCPRLSLGTNYTSILGSTISNIDSKDTVTMVVVLENTGHSGAYDVILQGTLSNATLSPTSTLCITRKNGTSVPFVGTSLFDGTGIALVDGISGSILPAEIIIITFDILLGDALVYNSDIFQMVGLSKWTSAKNGVNHVPVRYNTQLLESKSQITIPPITVVHTSTTSNIPDSLIATNYILDGEYLTFLFTLTLPEGLSNFSFLVTNNNILQYVNFTVQYGSSLSSVGVPSVTTIGSSTVINFPAIQNNPDNVANANDLVQLSILILSENGANKQATNALFNLINKNTGAMLWNHTDSYTFVLPSLKITQISVVNVESIYPQGGDTISVTLIVSRDNSYSLAPAYNVSIFRELFDIDVILVATPVHSSTGTVTWNPNQFEVRLNSFLSGDPNVTITFTLLIQNSTVAYSQIRNIYDVDYHSNFDALTGRSFKAISTAHIVDISQRTMTSTIYETSWNQTNAANGNTALSVGEVASVRYNISLIHGINPTQLTVEVAAPGVQRLVIVNASIVEIGNNVQVNSSFFTPVLRNLSFGVGGIETYQIEFKYNNISNPYDGTFTFHYFIVEVRVQALLAMAGQAGLVKYLYAELKPSLLATTITNTVYFTIVEPQISTTFVQGPRPVGTPIEAGTIISNTITIKNQAQSIGKTVGTAFLLTLRIPIISQMALVNSTLNTTFGSLVSGQVNTDTSVTITIPFIKEGETITIFYNTILLNNVLPATAITSTLTLNWTSSNGNLYGISGFNQSTTTSSSVTTITHALASVITSSSIPDTAVPNYVIGEIFTCNITITFMRGTTTPILTITAPVNAIQILSIQNTFTGATLTNINLNINLTASNTARINFGTITNIPSSFAIDKQCTFALTGRIRDNSTIFLGSTFNLRNDLNFDGKVLTSQLSYTVREPAIALNIVNNPTNVLATQTFTSRITVSQAVIYKAYNVSTTILFAGSLIVSANTTRGDVMITNSSASTSRLTVSNFSLNLETITFIVVLYVPPVVTTAQYYNVSGSAVYQSTNTTEGRNYIASYSTNYFVLSILQVGLNFYSTSLIGNPFPLVSIGQRFALEFQIVIGRGSQTFIQQIRFTNTSNEIKVQYLSSSIVFIGDQVSTSLVVGSQGVGRDFNSDSILESSSLNCTTSNQASYQPPNITSESLNFITEVVVLDVVANVAGKKLNTLGQVNYPSSGGVDVVNGPVVTIGEPIFNLTLTQDKSIIDGADSIKISVVMKLNAPAVTAYRLFIYDRQNTFFNVSNSSVVVFSGLSSVPDFETGVMELFVPALLPNNFMNFTYRITANPNLNILPNSTYSFTLNATYYSSDNATGYLGRFYTTKATYSLSTMSPFVTSSYVLSLPGVVQNQSTFQATLGETMTITANIYLIMGTNPITYTCDSNSATVVPFDSRVVYIDNSVSNSLLSVGGTATQSSRKLTFNFGSVIDRIHDFTTPQIIVSCTYIILSNSTKGSNFSLTTNFNYTTGQAVPTTYQGTVIVPTLTTKITTNITSYPNSTLQAGDRIGINLTVSHTNTSTAPAYELFMSDFFGDIGSELFTLVVGSAFSNVGVKFGGLNFLNITQTRLLINETLILNYVLEVTPNIMSNVNSYTQTIPMIYYTAYSNSSSRLLQSNSVSYTINIKKPTAVASVFSSSLADTQMNSSSISLSIGESGTIIVNVSLIAGGNLFRTITQSVFNVTGSTAIVDILSLSIYSLSSTPIISYPQTNVSTSSIFPLTFNNSGFGVDDYCSIDYFILNPQPPVNQYMALMINFTVKDRATNINGASTFIQNSFFTLSPIPLQTVRITVVEPFLQWTRSVSGAPLKSGLPLIDSNVVLTWTVTVSHTSSSTSPAYQVVIREELSSYFSLVPGSIIMTQNPVYGVIGSDSLAKNISFDLMIDYFPVNFTFTYSYQTIMTYQVRANSIYTLDTSMIYDSSSISAGGTGRRRSLTSINGTSSVISDSPTHFNYFSASYQYGLYPAGFTQDHAVPWKVHIGDVISITSVLSFHRGLTPTTLTVAASSLSTVLFFNASYTATSFVSPGIFDISYPVGVNAIKIDLGDVTDFSNIAELQNITIVIDILLLEDPRNFVGSQTTFFFSVDYGTGSLNDSLIIEIIEPDLLITSSYEIDSIYPSIDSISYAEAFNIITWHISIFHSPTSTADAFEVMYQDFNRIAMNKIHYLGYSFLNVTSSGNNSVVTNLLQNDTGLSYILIELFQLEKGFYFNFSYQYNLTLNNIANTTITIPRGLVRYQSLSDLFGTQSRTYFNNNETEYTFGIISPSIDSFRHSSSNIYLPTGYGVNDYKTSLGAIETIYINISPILGLTPVFVTVEVFGPGEIDILPVNCTILPYGIGINNYEVFNTTLVVNSTASKVEIDLGILINNQQDSNATIAITYRVKDIPTNKVNTTFQILSTLKYTNGTDTSLIKVIIGEPLLLVSWNKTNLITDFTADGIPIGEAGDRFNWTFTLYHDPSSSGDAYYVTLNQPDLFPYMGFVPSSLVITSVGPYGALINVSQHNLTIEYIPVNTSVTISIQTELLVPVKPGNYYSSNQSILSYFSSHGVVDSLDGLEGRYYQLNIPSNNFSFYTDIPKLESHLSYSSLDKLTGYNIDLIADTQIGEIIAVDTTISLIDGTNPLTLTVSAIGSGVLRIVYTQVMFIDSTIGGSLIPVGGNGTLFNSSLSNNDTVVFNFGSCIDLGYLTYGENHPENITVRVYYELLNVEENNMNSNVLFYLVSTLNYETGNISSYVNGTVSGPELVISKTVTSDLEQSGSDYINGVWGSILTFTINITHSSTSTDDAYQVIFYEPISNYFNYLNNSFILIQGNVNVSFVQNGNTTYIYVVDQILELGQSLIFNYSLYLNDNVIPNSTYQLLDQNITYNTADAQNQGRSGANRYVTTSFPIHFQTATPSIDEFYYSISDYNKPVGVGITNYSANVGESIYVSIICSYIRFKDVNLTVSSVGIGDLFLRELNSTILFNRPNGSQFLGTNPTLISNNVFYDFDNDVDNIDILSLSTSLVYFQVNNISSNINETTFIINSTLQYPTYKAAEKSVTGVIIEPLLTVTFDSINPFYPPVNKVTVVRNDSRVLDMTLTLKNDGNAGAYDVYIVQSFDSQLVPITGSFYINSTSLFSNMTFSYNSTTGNISKVEITFSNIDPFTSTKIHFQYYTAFLGAIGSFYTDINAAVDYRSTSLSIPSPYNRFYNTTANHTIGFSLVPIVEFYTFYYFDGEYLSYNTPGKVVGDLVTVYSANVGEGLLLNMIIFFAPDDNPMINLTFSSKGIGEVVFDITRSKVTSIGASMHNSSIPENGNPILIGQDLVFQFGPDLYNTGFLRGDIFAQSISIQVYCQVSNSSVNLNGVGLNISSTLSFIDDSTGLPGMRSTAITGFVIQPELEVILTGPSSTQIGDSGFYLEFSALIRHTNNSHAPAFLIEFYDIFNRLSASHHHPVNITITSLAYATTFASFNVTGVMCTISSLNISDSVSITYVVVIDDDILPEAEIIHEQYIDYRTSENSIYHNFTSYSNNWTGISPSLSFTFNASSIIYGPLDPNLTTLTIGEILIIDVTIHLIDGNNPITVNVSHPFNGTNGLFTIISSSVLRIDGVSGSLLSVGSNGTLIEKYGSAVSDTVVFDFGSSMTNLGTRTSSNIAIVRVLFVALDNVTFSDDGISFSIVSSVDFTPSDQSLYGMLVEPSLDISISATTNSKDNLLTQSGVVLLDYGDTIYFTVFVSHNSRSTSNSFEIEYYSLAQPEFSFIVNSVSIISPNSSLSVVNTGNTINDSIFNISYLRLSLIPNSTYFLKRAILPNETLTLKFAYKFNTLLSEVKFNQSTFLEYSSSNLRSYARRYRKPPNNLYFALVPVSHLTINATSIPDTYYNDTYADLIIGETMTVLTIIKISDIPMFIEYKLTVLKNSRSIVPLDIISSEVILSNFVFNSSLQNSSSGNLSSINAANDSILYNFGSIIFDEEFLNTTHDSITIITVFRVKTDVNNDIGDHITILGSFKFANNNEKNFTLNATILGPDLTISSVTPYSLVQGGDSIVFKATINHTNISTYDAHLLEVNDIFIPQLIQTQLPVVEIYNSDGILNDTIIWYSNTVNLMDVLTLGNSVVIYYYANVTQEVYPEVNFSQLISLNYSTGPAITNPNLKVSSDIWTSGVLHPNVLIYFPNDTIPHEFYNIGEEFYIVVEVIPINGHIPLFLEIKQLNNSGIDRLEVISSYVEYIDDMITNTSLSIGSNGTVLTSANRSVTQFTFGQYSTNLRFLNYSDFEIRSILFTLFYRVKNIPQNVNGTQFYISSLLFDNVSNFTSELNSTIVEPILIADFNYTKDILNGHVAYGETYSFTTRINHITYLSPAYLLNIYHYFDSTKIMIVGNITVLDEGTMISTNYSSFPIAIDRLSLNNSLKINYQLILTEFVSAGELINLLNQTVTYESMNNSFGRSYSIISEVSDIQVDRPQDYWKDLSSSLNLTKYFDALNATIGEFIYTSVNIDLINGINNLIIYIEIPLEGNLDLISSKVIFMDDIITNSYISVNSTIIPMDRNRDGFNDSIIMKFGELRNPRIGYTNRSTITIEFVLSPTNLDSTIVDKKAEISVVSLFLPSNYTLNTVRTITFIEPTLVTSINVSSIYPQVNDIPIVKLTGDVLTFNINCINNGNSIAYDSQVSFTLNTIQYEIIPSSFSSTLNYSYQNQEIVFYLPDMIPFEPYDITFQVSVVIDVQSQVDNFAQSEFTSSSIPKSIDYIFLRNYSVISTAPVSVNPQSLNTSGVCIGGIEVSALSLIFGFAQPLLPNPVVELLIFEQFVMESLKMSPNNTINFNEFALCFYWAAFRFPYFDPSDIEYYYRIYTESPYYLYYSGLYSEQQHFTIQKNESKKRSLIIDTEEHENITSYNPEKIPDIFYTTILWVLFVGVFYLIVGTIFFIIPAIFLWNRVINPLTKRREWLRVIESDEHQYPKNQSIPLKSKVLHFFKQSDDYRDYGDGALHGSVQTTKKLRKRKAKKIEKPWRLTHILTLFVGLIVRFLEVSHFPIACYAFFQVRRYGLGLYSNDYHYDYNNLDIIIASICMAYVVLLPFIYLMTMIFVRKHAFQSRYVMASLGVTYLLYTPHNFYWTFLKLLRNLFSAMAIGIFAGWILPSTIILFCVNLLYLLLLVVRRPYKSWVFFSYDLLLSIAKVIIGLLMVFVFWFNRSYNHLVPSLEIILIVFISATLLLHILFVVFWFIYYIIKRVRNMPKPKYAVLSIQIPLNVNEVSKADYQKLIKKMRQAIHENFNVTIDVKSKSNFSGKEIVDLSLCEIYHLRRRTKEKEVDEMVIYNSKMKLTKDDNDKFYNYRLIYFTSKERANNYIETYESDEIEMRNI